MSELVLRPRTATELLDAAFQVYQRAPKPFLVAMALIYLPWLAIQLIFRLDMPVPSASGQLGPAFLGPIIIGSIAGILIYSLAGAVGFVLARAVYLDEPVDVAAAFRLAFVRLPKLIAATIIAFVLAGIGFVLLFVPGVYLATRFFAIRQAIVLENAGPFAAFGRSATLSSGQKIHILATIMLVVILTLVVDGGAAALFGALSSKALILLLTTALSVIVYPLFVITETVLYFDTRVRIEGFDVEYLAGAPVAAATAVVPG